MVNILSGYDIRALGFNSADSVHVMTEAMRIAYFDRNNSLGDPEFIHNPLDKLLSTSYADEMRQGIHPTDATPSRLPESKQVNGERPETTHYSVVDEQGNAVSTTYTINGRFGAVVMAPGTGFFLNDEMDDFTTKIGEKNMFGLVQGANNAIAPGKRPLSSMAPTIVTHDNEVFLVLARRVGRASLLHHCRWRSISSITGCCRRKRWMRRGCNTSGYRMKSIMSSTGCRLIL